MAPTKERDTSIKGKLNQAVKIRYDLMEKKFNLWKSLGEIENVEKEKRAAEFQNWLSSYINITEKELKISEIFTVSIDQTLKQLKDIKSGIKKIPDKEKENAEKISNYINVLIDIFKKSKSSNKTFIKRVRFEEKLLAKEYNHRFGDKFLKKIQKAFKNEIYEQLKMLATIEKKADMVSGYQGGLEHAQISGVAGTVVLGGALSGAMAMMSVSTNNILLAATGLLTLQLHALTHMRKQYKTATINDTFKSGKLRELVNEGLI